MPIKAIEPRTYTTHAAPPRVPGQPAPSARLLRIQEVMHITGFGKSTIYAKISDGTFPKPIKISQRAVAWRLSEIEAWIADVVTNGQRV